MDCQALQADHCTSFNAFRSFFLENAMDHHLTAHRPAMNAGLPANYQPDAALLSSCHKLGAGKAVTLRARQLSVLRIAHGRVWVTLSQVGPYSRVLAGDHFLSRGQSLTLLAGQELVMEPFEPSASGCSATAHFSWQSPGVAASTLQASGMGVLEPLRDLRHALGLVADACGRLVQALAHSAANAPRALLNVFATIFVAINTRT
ncbi:MAG: DUF2917 domain-containing protein [Polaromonas sp.]|nr:MAG: DUF2917 domain-containing protein [Polaromonas sp.]